MRAVRGDPGAGQGRRGRQLLHPGRRLDHVHAAGRPGPPRGAGDHPAARVRARNTRPAGHARPRRSGGKERAGHWGLLLLSSPVLRAVLDGLDRFDAELDRGSPTYRAQCPGWRTSPRCLRVGARLGRASHAAGPSCGWMAGGGATARSCARWARARCRWRRACRSTRSCWARANCGLHVRARRDRDAGRPAGATGRRSRAAHARRAATGGCASRWLERASPPSSRPSTASSPPGAGTTRNGAVRAAARHAAADRRRPAHAHRPLPRLRDAGRGAARDRARAAASARSP